MNKFKAYAIPMVLLLLLGWSCSPRKTSQSSVPNIPGCCVTDSNLSFVNLDTLHGTKCYNITMRWNEKLLSVYKTHYDNVPVCEFLIGKFPKEFEEQDVEATRKIVFWSTQGEWSDKQANVYTFNDGSCLEIGLDYPGPDRIPTCPIPPKPDNKLPPIPQVELPKH